MNLLISAAIGAGLAFTAIIGGVHAVSGNPSPVAKQELYSYGDE
jgi:hypothetical protein